MRPSGRLTDQTIPVIVIAAMLTASCSSQPEVTTTTTAATSISAGPTVTSATADDEPTTTINPSDTTINPSDTTINPSDTTSADERDSQPPRLVVTDPKNGATVDTDRYTFRGLTEPGATVVASGRYRAPVTGIGTWAIVLVLNVGPNGAMFVATDPAGNQTEVRLTVSYLPQTDTTGPPEPSP